MKHLRVLLVLFSVSAAACGAKGKPLPGTTTTATKGGSCVEAKAGVCTEFEDDTLGLEEGACTKITKGAWSKSPCATADAIGTCKKKQSKVVYYTGNGVAPWVDDAKADCETTPFGESKGVFTAAANMDQAAKDKTIPDPAHIWGSCKRKDGASCKDIIGHAMQADFVKSFCEKDPQKEYSVSPCSTDKVVGTCVQPMQGNAERNYVEQTKLVPVKEIEKWCAGTSHWVAGIAAPIAPAAAPPATVALSKPPKPAKKKHKK